MKAGATHVAVATDHVIESFRNGLCQAIRPAKALSPTYWRSRRELLLRTLATLRPTSRSSTQMPETLAGRFKIAIFNFDHPVR
jgi:hypothetical protein